MDSGVLATSAVFPGRVDSSAAPGPGPAPSQADQVGLCGMSCWLCFWLQPWGHPGGLRSSTKVHGFAKYACSLARGLSVSISVGFPEVVFRVKGFVPRPRGGFPIRGTSPGAPTLVSINHKL